MKLIYSACKAVRRDISFPQKVIRVFNPLDSNIQRLVSRKGGGGTASVHVTSDSNVLSMAFSTQTKKWDAEVKGEATWERQLGDLTCTLRGKAKREAVGLLSGLRLFRLRDPKSL